jgi:hypothetical protein
MVFTVGMKVRHKKSGLIGNITHIGTDKWGQFYEVEFEDDTRLNIIPFNAEDLEYVEPKWKRSFTIREIEWHKVFDHYCAYQKIHNNKDVEIDGAVPQPWWDAHRDEIVQHLGACTIEPWCNITFRDQILSDMGIELEWEEDN